MNHRDFLFAKYNGCPVRRADHISDCATALRFRGDGTFSIVQFADLHFGEAENLGWGPLQDLGSLHVINAVLDNEKPDLAVFTGDQITGNNIKQNATAYWKMIVEPCEVRHTHFASIFGNHDTMPFETGYELSDHATRTHAV